MGCCDRGWTNQAQFLLRRKLIVEGLTETQWEDFIQELNHHPCVDFAERKSENRLVVTMIVIAVAEQLFLKSSARRKAMESAEHHAHNH